MEAALGFGVERLIRVGHIAEVGGVAVDEVDTEGHAC